MTKSLSQARHSVNTLLKRVRDADDLSRFEAAAELYWNDLVSLLELIDDLRAYHATTRKWNL
jgi:signal transduction histidine kinase